jgi:alanine racemase
LSSTVAEISLPALRHNLFEVVRRVGGSTILAVVKADAYGHGAIPVARALLAAGASRLGVATVAEALELRGAGVTAPVLVMGGGLLEEELPEVLRHNLTPVLPSRESVDELARYAARQTSPLPVHLKIDTGMGRLGLSPEEAQSLLESSWPSSLYLEGLMSHLSCADEADQAATEAQLVRFRSLLAALKESGIVVPVAHIAGTAGILRYPASHFDMVRPGLMLYGYAPGATPADGLRPVLTWKTHVVQVKRLRPGQCVSYGGTFVADRPMTLAVLGVGYADGFSRDLSNQGRVLIKGRMARVLGRVCMDLTMVDVTEIPSVQFKEEAVLIGRQGSTQITADDLATQLGTISYEILSRIGRRVLRVYRDD